MHKELSKITDAPALWRHFHDDFWREAAAEICRRRSLSYLNLKRIAQGENIVFFVDDRFVVKIYPPFFRRGYFREKAALEFAARKLSIKTPEILHIGEIENWFYTIMTQLHGIASREVWFGLEQPDKLRIISRLGVALKELHSYPAPLDELSLNRDWSEYVKQKADSAVERQRACEANPEWLERLPSYIAENFDLLPKDFTPVMLHGDAHALNLLFTEENGRWEISGLIDFGDSFCGFHEYEFVAPGVLMVQGNGQLQREMLLAYGYKENELDLNLRARLMLLTILYECSDLRKYALRLAPEAVNFTLEELEAAIWRFV